MDNIIISKNIRKLQNEFNKKDEIGKNLKTKRKKIVDSNWYEIIIKRKNFKSYECS